MPGQGVPVTAQPGGEEPDEDIPVTHQGRAQDLVTLDHPHGEAHQVELTGLHHPGVLGHLTAEQCGTDLAAPVGHPRDQLGHLGRVHRPRRDVVEQEEWLSALAHQIVDAHGHQVDANGVEPSDGLGHQRLGAHPVGAGHQHRLAVALGVEGEQATEAAQRPEHLGPEGGGHHRTDEVDRPLASPDVDAGPGVGGGRKRVRGRGRRWRGRVGNGSAHAGGPLAAPLSAVRWLNSTGTGTG